MYTINFLHGKLKQSKIEIPKKGVCQITGPNASGKTTLAKSIANAFNNGEVIISRAEIINTLGPQKFQYVPQDVKLNNFINMSVQDFFDLHRTSNNLLMQYWDNYIHTNIHKLSGGQQKFLLLTAAMSVQCIKILDEPLENLDSNLAQQVVSFINNDKESLYIITSHSSNADINCNLNIAL